MNNSNPFDRPGMGQGSAANPILQSLDMMNKAWQQFAQAQQAGNPMFAMQPPLNAEELDKRIQELKNIESWLTMNLSMLSSTIQGLEIQRASINTLKTFVDNLQMQDQGSSLEDVLGLKRSTPAGGAGKQDKRQTQQSQSGNDEAMPFSGESMTHAAQAWWDMLQNQFSQLSKVATEAMHKEPDPVKKPGPAPDQPGDPKEPVKPAARKRAATSAARGKTRSRTNARE